MTEYNLKAFEKKSTVTKFKIGKDYISKIILKGYIYKISPKLRKKKSKLSYHHRNHKDCIFITTRYRTGSSYFYSLFSCLKDTIVFYEPLHPDLITTLDQNEECHRRNKEKLSHTFQGKYFEEYDQLDKKCLELLHRKDFIDQNLILSKTDTYEEEKEYILFLLNSKIDKFKVLQFNRIDFQLEWFKNNFPNALIVNLKRNPRDIYISHFKTYLREQNLQLDKLENIKIESTNISCLFYVDDYIRLIGDYLHPNFCFPELNDYEKIYLLNSLSNLYADKFADVIIEYEKLVEEPKKIIEMIASQVKNLEPTFVEDIVIPKKDRIDTWKEYHDESWYSQCESRCEDIIEEITKHLNIPLKLRQK